MFILYFCLVDIIYFICALYIGQKCVQEIWKFFDLIFFPPSFTLGCNLFCQKCKGIHFSNLTGKNWKEPGTGQYDVTQ